MAQVAQVQVRIPSPSSDVMQSSPPPSISQQPPGSGQKAPPQVLPDNTTSTGGGNINPNANNPAMGMNQAQQPNNMMNGINSMSWMFNQGTPNTMNNGTGTNGAAATTGGGINPTDLNSVMNAMLMNNALQQQAQQQQVQAQQQQVPQQQQQAQQQQQQQQNANNMMNPLVLQTMINQGMIPNTYGNTAAMGQMQGMNNLFQQGMMNPATAAAGMMGGLVNVNNAMGATGGNAAMGMDNTGGNSSAGTNATPNNYGNAMQARGGSTTYPESAVAVAGNGNGMDGSNTSTTTANNVNNNDLLLQLMSSPLAAQLMAQGINPMLLLGAAGGGAGMGMGMGGMASGMGMMQNQFVPNNSLGALALGMNGMGGGGFNTPGIVGANRGLDVQSAAGVGGFNQMMNAAATMDPNTLFMLNQQGGVVSAVPRGIAGMMATATEDGIIKHHGLVGSGKGGEKLGKKTKIKGKPKRPLSAYNFFFREERSRILDNLPSGSKKDALPKKEEEDDTEDDEKKVKEEQAEPQVEEEDGKRKGRRGKKEEDSTDSKPSKGKDDEKTNDEEEEAKEKDYDQVGPDGKKIPHGKIGFESLAKQIGKRWQSISAEEMERYKALADEDMTRYKREMEAFLNKEVSPSTAASLPLDGVTMAHHAVYGVMNQQQLPLAVVKKSKTKRKEGVEVKPRKTKKGKKSDDDQDETLV